MVSSSVGRALAGAVEKAVLKEQALVLPALAVDGGKHDVLGFVVEEVMSVGQCHTDDRLHPPGHRERIRFAVEVVADRCRELGHRPQLVAVEVVGTGRRRTGKGYFSEDACNNQTLEHVLAFLPEETGSTP